MILFKNKKLEIPVGLGPNFQEGSGEILNQNKTVDSSTVYQIVYPDAGYSGLGKVIVNPYELDSKEVDSSTVTQVVTSDKDGLYSVVVNPYVLDEKTVNSSTNTQEITSDADGLSKVVINPYTLDEKTVDSSTNPQVITSDEDGLRQVTIRPYVLGPLEVDSSTAMQEITGQYGTVTVNPYVLDSKTVKSSTSRQTVTSSKDGLSSVIVEPYVLDNKTVDPSTNNITVTSSKDGLSSVTVTPVTSSIDSNISAGNIKNGVTILGVQGTYSGTTINNQNKTIDSSTSVQSVTYDSGYTGLGTVTVNPYTLQNKALQLEPSYRNEDVRGAVVKVEPDEGYDGLSYFQYRLPSILTSKTFDASTGNQTYVTNTANTYVKGINKIVINGLDLDSCYTLAASI